MFCSPTTLIGIGINLRGMNIGTASPSWQLVKLGRFSNNFDFLSCLVESCGDFPPVVEEEVGERMRRLGCDFYAGQNPLPVCALCSPLVLVAVCSVQPTGCTVQPTSRCVHCAPSLQSAISLQVLVCKLLVVRGFQLIAP